MRAACLPPALLSTSRPVEPCGAVSCNSSDRSACDALRTPHAQQHASPCIACLFQLWSSINVLEWLAMTPNPALGCSIRHKQALLEGFSSSALVHKDPPLWHADLHNERVGTLASQSGASSRPYECVPSAAWDSIVRDMRTACLHSCNGFTGLIHGEQQKHSVMTAIGLHLYC